MFGYLYKTTIYTKRHALVYVGKRQSKKFRENYYGSGVIIRRMRRMEPIPRMSVEFVSAHHSADELCAAERDLVAATKLKYGRRCINIALGGGGGTFKKWTIGKCKRDALKYTTRKQWQEKSNSAYRSAWKEGWLDECCAHMDMLQRPKGYWNLDRCKADALKFNTRSEWQNKSPSACGTAYRNGWIEECCAHMHLGRKLNGYWSLEQCKEDAAKYKSIREWAKSSGGYSTAARNGWIDECSSHMSRDRLGNNYWTFDRCVEEARKYPDWKSWKAGSGGSINAATKNKWLVECTAHMSRSRVPNGHWTFDRCCVEARKYDSRVSWKKGSVGSYNTACKNGWIDDCAPHLSKWSSLRKDAA